jgi:hypothetical protein
MMVCTYRIIQLLKRPHASIDAEAGDIPFSKKKRIIQLHEYIKYGSAYKS